MRNITLLLVTFFLTLGISCSEKTSAKGSNIKAEKIIDMINDGENVMISGGSIIGKLDFTTIKNKSIETIGLERAYIDVSITFINCTFTEKVISTKKGKDKSSVSYFSKNLSFLNCDFKEEVKFDQSIFIGTVSFNQSKFEKAATFQAASFRAANNYFMEVTFNNKALFNSLHVLGNINFMKSNFVDVFSLQKSFINGKALFGASTFNAYADFSASRFMDLFDCKYSKFKGKAVFSFSVFFDNLKLADAEFTGNLEINQATFYEELQFKNAKLSENTKISNSFFHKQSSSELIEIQSYLSDNLYYIN